MLPHLQPRFAPRPDPRAVVTAAQVRFTVLTSRLLRLEYVPAGREFEDRPSQVFWFREQPVPPFEVRRNGDTLEIETEHLRLEYRPGERPGFDRQTLSIELLQEDVTWRYGEPDRGNLLGTTRTLDKVSGDTELEPGLLSRHGWTVWDDSHSLLFNEAGWLEPRPDPAGSDLYFFGYGRDYTACLQDFMRVAGRVPMVPRWLLGNWWSRYWEYSQDELAELIRDFQRHEVPLAVCVIDMDWHITETGNRCSGWTGYTWNRELFPDPAGFLKWLHEQGLRTSLNLHPAEGVHAHEAQYVVMCAELGVDPESEEPIPFDLADPRFAKAYFELLHHPLEEQGIDFWWIDWQQGELSSLPGLDPLWWLNHLHFYDLGRDGKTRPFVFSRWGGLGNHRYPIGFSGDTFVNWPSLAFQPFFTATAANVGYSWWSHDIGGHMFGTEEEELYLRWVQFGVFSPIFRLHSTKNRYHERRPWGHDAETLQLARYAMQLRHALIPYLYSLGWQNHSEGMAAIRPLYHDYPEEEAAYHCPGQYTFGPDLIAAPYTTPADPDTRLSRKVVWLPAGSWTNFFTGERYEGGRWQAIYGTRADIPVFARAGAIVPLGQLQGWGGLENPEHLDVLIFPGADGRFELYEDDGETVAYLNGAYALTPMVQTWADGRLTVTIEPATGETGLIPGRRSYRLLFRGVEAADAVTLAVNDEAQAIETHYDAATRTLEVAGVAITPQERLMVTLEGVRPVALTSPVEIGRRLLRHFRLETGTKAAIADQLPAIVEDYTLLANYTIPLAETQLRALLEVVTGAGVARVQESGEEERVILWNNGMDSSITYRLNAFREVLWHTARVYRPEQGIVPPQQILTGRQLAKHGRWQVTMNYGGVYAQVVSSEG